MRNGHDKTAALVLKRRAAAKDHGGSTTGKKNLLRAAVESRFDHGPQLGQQ